MSDEEAFARLIFCGVTQLHRPEHEVWLMPIGHLLDQREIFWQVNGLATPLRSVSIDDIIPYGI